MFASPHAAFILASFGLTALVILALVVWIVIDRARLSATLKTLEERGTLRQTGRELP